MRLWLLVFIASTAFASPLEEARQALTNGRAANKFYELIKFGDPDFPARLEDAMRYHILQKKYQEAWRVAQLAIKIKNVHDAPYYAKLSSYLAGSCVTGISGHWDLLVEAAYYRFAKRFDVESQPSDPFAALESGRIVSSLGPGRLPFLQDLPQTKLIPRAGCRFFKNFMTDAPRRELQLVRRFLEETKDDIAGNAAVEMRAIVLTGIVPNSADFAEELLEPYAKADPKLWLSIPSEDRQFLWQRLVEEEFLSDSSLSLHDEEQKNWVPVVEHIILATNDSSASNWLGLLKWQALPHGRRLAILRHTSTIDHMPHREELLLNLAYTENAMGHTPEALSALRQIFAGDRSYTDAIDQAAVDIGVRIFAKYRYDPAILGAMQTALPTRLWDKLMGGLLIGTAIAGDHVNFKKLVDYQTANRKSAWSSKVSTKWLQCVARRNVKCAESVLSSQRGLGGLSMEFIESVAKNMFELDDQERKNLAPYVRPIASLLQKSRFQNREKVVQLVQIFESPETSRWVEGSAASSNGTVMAGRVALDWASSLPNSFTWQKVSPPAPRNLVVMPASATLRDWVIQ